MKNEDTNMAKDGKKNELQTRNNGIKWWKYSGIFLVATGIIHTVFGVAVGKDYLMAIVKNGFFNSVGDDADFGVIFWFLICGIVVIILGQTLHYYIKKEQQPAPVSLGYWLLGLSVIGCMIIPASGFWLFIPQAFIILFAKRKENDN